MGRARCQGLVLALAMVTAMAGAPPSKAAEKAIWGPVGDVPGAGSAFGLYRRLGVDTFQIGLDFAHAAPTRPAEPRDPGDPAYRWPAALDRAVSEGSRTGIRIAVLVQRSPGWANGGRPEIWRPRSRAFADFLTAASRRYPTVRRWMIWGEPSRISAFQPNRLGTSVGPRAYSKLLDASYGALKAASPRNIVIGGMTYTGGGPEGITPAKWLRGMRLPNGRPPRLDWFGHNPFPFRFPNLRKEAVAGGYRDTSDLDLFAREIARTYTRRCGRRRCGRRPKLWLSEYAIQSDHGSGVFRTYVSRGDQARWLTAAYRIANSLPSVAGLGWLALQDEPESNLSANFGLLTASGVRKPSFFAYGRAPSRAFRPSVRAPRRVSRGTLARRGLRIEVRAPATGRISVRLRVRGGRTLRRSARKTAAGRIVRLRLGPGRFQRGGYLVGVDAPRGERVIRRMLIR